jgi:hypothetical protein
MDCVSPAETKDFSSSLCVRPALRPTQPLIQWVSGAHSWVKARLGCDTADLSPSNAEVKNE